jgi:Domain of unknown function (DUF5625)
MYITSLCAFPPLFSNVPIALSSKQVSTEHTFEAPVSTEYTLELVLGYSASLETVNDFLGNRGDVNCHARFSSEKLALEALKGNGTPTPLEVIIKRIDKPSVEQRFFSSGACSPSWWSRGEVGRTIARTELEKGKYTIRIRSLADVTLPSGVKSTLQLSPLDGK